MHSNDLEACGMKLCCFWFHSDVKFLTRSLYSGERQWPTWASCYNSLYTMQHRGRGVKLGVGTFNILSFGNTLVVQSSALTTFIFYCCSLINYFCNEIVIFLV